MHLLDYLQVALVVGHELAHQWFGNLTTMEWWTDLWLNEGFASWIEFLCVDYCCKEYEIWKQFVCTEFTKALELDGLRNSHPIEVEVKNPAEIDEIFDAISYSKGASVIRMLYGWLGEEDFKAGLKSYLTTYQYKNGKTSKDSYFIKKINFIPFHTLRVLFFQFKSSILMNLFIMTFRGLVAPS